MPLLAGSSAATRHFEDGEEVFSCRCGETHRGPYAAYDYWHHNCLHEELRRFIESDDPNEVDVICPQCGQTWTVRSAD